MITEAQADWTQATLVELYGYRDARVTLDNGQLSFIHNMLVELLEWRKEPAECLPASAIELIDEAGRAGYATSPTSMLHQCGRGVALLLHERLNLLKRFPPSAELLEQIACVKREIALRERVYPGLTKNGKLKPEQAATELRRMRDVLGTLERLRR